MFGLNANRMEKLFVQFGYKGVWYTAEFLKGHSTPFKVAHYSLLDVTPQLILNITLYKWNDLAKDLKYEGTEIDRQIPYDIIAGIKKRCAELGIPVS